MSDDLSSLAHRVAGLIREELLGHGRERWREPLGRVGARAGTTVALIEREGWPSKAGPPHGRTSLERALSEAYICVGDERWLVFAWEKFDDGDNGGRQVRRSPASEESFESQANGRSIASELPGGAGSERTQGQPAVPPYNEAFLIREFDRRQRERGPIFAGFIINDLLPRLGFPPPEAKRILRQLEARNIVTTLTKPNPANPDRRTTFVELNRDHPLVAQTLGAGQPVTATKLPLGRSSGELGSDLLIRERR